MNKHEKARKALKDNFNLNGSTAEEFMFLSNYIDDAEKTENEFEESKKNTVELIMGIRELGNSLSKIGDKAEDAETKPEKRREYKRYLELKKKIYDYKMTDPNEHLDWMLLSRKFSKIGDEK